MANIVCHLLGTKVSKYCVCLLNDYSRQAIVPGNNTQNAEDFVSSTISCIEKSISIFEGRILFFLHYYFCKKDILSVSFLDSIKKVSCFLNMSPKFGSHG
jgi:hypothetical protein